MERKNHLSLSLEQSSILVLNLDLDSVGLIDRRLSELHLEGEHRHISLESGT
jgi:hypothetical protein